MARRRDYAAEYQRRQSAARSAGWQSYWHERQTRKAAQDYTGTSRRAFVSVAKNPPAGITPSAVRTLWAEGDEAMRNGDIERAREIAQQLGVRSAKPTYPPESAFWYH